MTQPLPARTEIDTKYSGMRASCDRSRLGFEAPRVAAINDVRLKGRLAEGPALVGEAMADMQRDLAPG
jgi:hypothetical protein